MSGKPTEKEKAKARTELKKLIPAWRKAAREVEEAKATFKDAAREYWKLKDNIARIAKTAEINPAVVQPAVKVRDVDRLLAREKGGILRSQVERIKRVRQLLEDLEKK